MNESTWKNIHLSDDEIASYRVGPLTIYLKKILNEIWIAENRDEERSGDPAPLPEEPLWVRAALPEPYDSFTLSPAFPDRPVVVDTEFPYKIFSSTRARAYCRIPVFVQITPVKNPDLIVTEIPTVVLSGTWFGIFTEGEHSYALSSTVRRVLTDDLFEPHLVVCPIEIVNSSAFELRFEKVCLRVTRLSIYSKENALWADETRINHHSKEGHNDIEMKGVVPVEAKGGKLISKPRIPERKSFADRSFNLLREFSVPGF